jgi:hypothetical protein
MDVVTWFLEQVGLAWLIVALFAALVINEGGDDESTTDVR